MNKPLDQIMLAFGTKDYVAIDQVLGILTYPTGHAKKLLKRVESGDIPDGIIFDATRGRKCLSIIWVKGRIFIKSPQRPETLINRLSNPAVPNKLDRPPKPKHTVNDQQASTQSTTHIRVRSTDE